jgi:5-methyltetrahydrofolate--homocysteine methyltransferase
MEDSILDALNSRVLVADGAMGTELQRLGLELGVCGELWNLENPNKIRSVNQSYANAGAQIITTNTFRGTRLALTEYGLESRIEEINFSAVSIARQVAGDMAWVLGSVGPLGGFLEPLGDISTETAFDNFAEQITALLEGGVDGIIIETMTAIEEYELAIRAARETGASVVIATMAFDKVKDGYKTMMGISPAQTAEAAIRNEADVIGCNCGAHLELQDYVEITRQLRSYSDKPLIVQPNAGQPDLVAGEIVYGLTPQAMAAKVSDLVTAGANIIGGCCGTTPEHIRLIAEQVHLL